MFVLISKSQVILLAGPTDTRKVMKAIHCHAIAGKGVTLFDWISTLQSSSAEFTIRVSKISLY